MSRNLSYKIGLMQNRRASRDVTFPWLVYPNSPLFRLFAFHTGNLCCNELKKITEHIYNNWQCMRVILFFLALLGLLSLLSMIKLPQNTPWQDSMTSILLCSPSSTFSCCFILFTLFMHVECLRRGEWWSKIINNIHTMRGHEIQDVLVFVYLDIHFAICQNSKYTNFMQSIFTWNVCC